jgi:ComF family protein
LAWKRILKELTNLVFPEHCLICEAPLTYGEEQICSTCLQHLAFTELPFSENNVITRLLQAKTKVYKATALLIYDKHGTSGKLIHRLKYDGKTGIGTLLARYLYPQIASDPPGIIIPIPLHPRKMKIRGYNQLETFGRHLAEKLGATYRDDILIKTVHTESQTSKNPLDRWQNVLKTFQVTRPEELEGEHVLLIDDVLTTGATLSAAAEILRKHTRKMKLSIAVMAFNWH